MEGLSHQIHVLTLVIKRQRDIPLARSKAKLLGGICGFSGTKRVQIALMASEVARFLIKNTGGGRVVFFLVCASEASNASFSGSPSGIMVHFIGKKSCPVESYTNEEHGDFTRIFGPMKSMADHFQVNPGTGEEGFELKVVILGGQASCDELLKGQERIRQQLFRDVEESYMENLRAKHEEVLSLLKTLSLKNKELDKVNAELLELSRDMESLVHERTVVEFALRIADKIRNPATVIGGLARIVLKRLPKDFPDREKIEAIYLEAQKLEAIVKDFEGLARQQERFLTQVVLQDLVREILDAWEPNFEKKGINLRFHTAKEPIKIRANPRTLKVAILHILKNAVDASPAGSDLEVNVEKIDGRPVLEIVDQGPGISSDVKTRLFKELVTTKPSGTGVGLIMVHHIMKEHQGQVHIESSPGKGTRVRLIFPERWKEGKIEGPF